MPSILVHFLEKGQLTNLRLLVIYVNLYLELITRGQNMMESSRNEGGILDLSQ